VADNLVSWCQQVVTGCGEGISWEWDGRFAMVMGQVRPDVRESIMVCLQKAFDGRWSARDLDDAPDDVKALADDMGGLRPGQLLFAKHATNDDAMVYAAWWPWGNGTLVSVRIGVHESEEGLAELKTQFGV